MAIDPFDKKEKEKQFGDPAYRARVAARASQFEASNKSESWWPDFGTPIRQLKLLDFAKAPLGKDPANPKGDKFILRLEIADPTHPHHGRSFDWYNSLWLPDEKGKKRESEYDGRTARFKSFLRAALPESDPAAPDDLNRDNVTEADAYDVLNSYVEAGAYDPPLLFTATPQQESATYDTKNDKGATITVERKFRERYLDQISEYQPGNPEVVAAEVAADDDAKVPEPSAPTGRKPRGRGK